VVDAPDAIVTNTDDMVLVHQALRREFALLPRMIRAVPDGDKARAEIVGAHCEEMLEVLHHHHEGEDEELWPILEARAVSQQDLLSRMESQHKAVAELAAGLPALLSVWRRSAAEADGEPLAAGLDEVSAALNEHLHDEEQQVLPLVREYVTNGEWAVLGQRGMASMPKPRMLVFLGYMLEDATPAQRDHFMGRIPLPPRLLYRFVGQRKYHAERDALRAGL
jgi:hemerythrin-like domain-containing protein